jgi:hypothetical protein
MARPQVKIDPELVRKYAASGYSAEQIAAFLEVDRTTIEQRFSAILKTGWKHAHGRLQVKLFQAAIDDNIAAMIFLAKNWLGMTDRPETIVNVVNTVPTVHVPNPVRPWKSNELRCKG